MKFIVDECTGDSVAKWLRLKGFEVFSVFAQKRGVDDEWIIEKAVSEDYVIVSNDKDFGELIFRHNKRHRGVIFLRLKDESVDNKIDVIEKVLELFENDVSKNFIVATEEFVRISRKVSK